MRYFAILIVALATASPALAWHDCGYHHTPKPPVVVPAPPSEPGPPRVCADGLPPDAGKDGHVPASGNGNDDCDHTGDPRLG
jgi:hypothetical protein